MPRRTLLSALIGIAALLAALALARWTARQMQAQVISAPVVVARQVIPPQVVITADMLTTREFPRAVASAPIYRDIQELIGLVSRVEIVPDAPIFKTYAVPPREARFSADPGMTAIALRVDTARAVGGLVTPGQRVDVWRIARAQPPAGLDADTLVALKGAGVSGAWRWTLEVLARNLRVLSVQAGLGGGGASAGGGLLGLGRGEGEAQQTSGAISVVTVEASQEVAPDLVRLMGEVGVIYDLWLTLSPLERDPAALASPTPDRSALVQALTPTATPTATATPTPTATPLAWPALNFTPVVSGLSAPVHIAHAGDGSGRLFLVEQAGRIRILAGGALQPTPFLDIADRVSCCGERGLLSIAFP
ncbi:MAG: Flp pilus assembly protein CpaB, partial [Anaerolineae bacterium]